MCGKSKASRAKMLLCQQRGSQAERLTQSTLLCFIGLMEDNNWGDYCVNDDPFVLSEYIKGICNKQVVFIQK